MLKVHYVNTECLNHVLHKHAGKVLAQISYGSSSSFSFSEDGLKIVVNVPVFPGMNLTEVWSGETLVSHHIDDSIAFVWDEQTLVGCIQALEEPEVPLEITIHRMYNKVLGCMRVQGYPNLIRIWNYLSNINNSRDGLERYQRFCIGRHQAFSERSNLFHSALPAASAVGMKSGPVLIYFIAQKTKGLHFENPRQMSAYHYPSTYGPKSPSFARATLSQQDRQTLFLAGTASIVGHATQHPRNIHEQTLETLRNLDALLDHVKKEVTDVESVRFTCQAVKVYIRPGQPMMIVKEIIEKHLGSHVPTLYLAAKLCRKDLLVEIESIFSTRNEVETGSCDAC